MLPKGLIALVLGFLLCSASVDSFFFGPSTRQNNWDILVFVQHWPKSVCDKYMQQRSGNGCNNYPKDHWTAHGIWPTLRGTRGPNDCDPSRRLNMEEISGLVSDLQEWWTPIQSNSRLTYFWEHEWAKHGTCADPAIPTQYQYFKQALDWMRQYEMGQIFRTSGIVPGRDYSFNEIMEGVKRVVRNTPEIVCYVDNNRKTVLLEVRLCFDRSFKLIDCNSNSNCDRGAMLHYPEAN